MRKRLFLLALLAAVACGKKTPAEPEHSFSVVVPDGWHVIEEKPWSPDRMTLAGQDTGVWIIRYPSAVSDNYSDALKYAKSFWQLDPKGKQPVLEKKIIGGRLVIFFHREHTNYKLHSKQVFRVTREKYALIPVPGGFLEVRQSVPVDDYQKYERGFLEIVSGIKPKN